MGFVKVDRSIIDSDIYFDDKLLAFYVRLLLLVRIRPCIESNVLVDRGQLFTSERRLANILNIHYSTVSRYLNLLAEKHFISMKKYTDGSLITVLDIPRKKPKSENMKHPNKDFLQHPNDVFLQQRCNTSATDTLLYNKKVNMVKQGVSGARKQKTKVENFNIEDDREEIKKSELRDLQIPTRESLVEKYGEANVFEYECRFERWRSRQRKNVAITCYEAIERWMRDDHVQKTQQKSTSEAAYDTDEIMRRIINSYND